MPPLYCIKPSKAGLNGQNIFICVVDGNPLGTDLSSLLRPTFRLAQVCALPIAVPLSLFRLIEKQKARYE